MSMKTLQNNFTTPEQSKKMLELGVLANSADCYYTKEEIEGNIYWFDLHIKREYQPHTSLHASIIWGDTLPCWSVGRLIEISEICSGIKFERADDGSNIMQDAFDTIYYLQNILDFSKLKE